MKNVLFFLIAIVLVTGAFVQNANADVTVTVTNPGNTTPGLAATYPSLAGAISALNSITAISGPVTLTCAASGTETAPAGGYVINFTATTTASNYIIINGSGSTVTASAALTAGSLNDAIFKIIGSDYVTLQGFTLNENALNTTTDMATNNMTEWGVALLYASLTDGAQYNTIENNTIELNRSYLNTFGIYSNTRHSASNIILVAEVTAFSGSNSYNKVYGNIIRKVNYGIVFVGAGTTTAAMDNGNDIGGSSAATGNSISDYGGGAAPGLYVSVPTTINYGIVDNHQINDNVSYNTITSATGLSVPITFGGIVKTYTDGQPTGTFTTTVTNNTVTVTNAPTTTGVVGISNGGLTPALSTATMNINNNTILNCSITGAATSSGMTAIANTSAPGVLNINNNIIRGNSTTATTGTFAGIANSGAVVTTCSINDNQIGNGSGGAITLSSVTTGAVVGISNTGGAATCALSISGNNFQGFNYVTPSTGTFQCINTTPVVLTETINNNNFNNLTVNSSASIGGFLIGASNATPSVIINGNYVTTKFLNITSTGGANNFALYNAGTPTTGSSTVSNNIFSNITFKTTTSFGAAIYWNVGTGATCTHNSTITNNTISDISNTGASLTTQVAAIYGILLGFGNNNVISNNTVYNLTSAAGAAIGIFGGSPSPNPAGTMTISGNTIYGIKTTTVYNATSGGSSAQGIQIQAGPAVNNVYKNKIYDISCVPSSLTGGVAYGIFSSQTSATCVTNIYNNYIGKIYSNLSNNWQCVRGINLGSTVANTTNLYYNTVYLDGIPAAGSYCIYKSSATSIANFRNNIFSNNCSSASGYEQFAYFFVGVTSTTNYLTTSNNNLLYCGTPGPLNLIYADGAVNALTNKKITLAEFKTFAAPRESASVTENVSFLNTTTGSSANYLHIDPAVPTQVESGAVNIATYTDDYDNVIRQGNAGYTGTGTAPDIGADEGEFVFPIPMAFVSSTTTQNTANTAPNSPNQQIIGIQVVTSGTVTPFTVSSFTVNANGSTNVLDIANARIYYTGNVPTFSTSGLFGTVASPTFADFNITGSQVLASGINYFWLTFDITAGAAFGDLVDAECAEVVGSGTMGTQKPDVTVPAGARTILGPMSGDYTVGLTGFNKAAGTNITFRKVVKKVMKEVRELQVEKSAILNPIQKGGITNIATLDGTGNYLPSNTFIREGEEVSLIQDNDLPLLDNASAMNTMVELEETSWVPMENGRVYEGPLSIAMSGHTQNSPNAPLAGVYATITAAIADLNVRGVNGPVRFLLNDASYTTGETYPIIINVQNANVPTISNPVTIKPNIGVTSSITGASSGAEIFRIYNTNYITIDGSNTVGGTTRDLTITNSSSTSPEVIDINSTGTTPVVGAGIKNCNIINGSQNSSAVILTDLAGTAGYFNNITIQNNSIQKAYIGIYNLATALAGNGTGLNISGNDLNTSGANSIRLIGIYVQGFDGATIANNNIGNNANTVDASNITGIWFATGTINATISGNTISDISGTAGAPRGVVVTSAVANANVIVAGNTISGMTTSSTGTAMGLWIGSTTSGVTVEKNRVSNIKNTNSGGWGCNGIYLASTLNPANIKVVNNVIYDVAAFGFAGSSVLDNGYGIVVESGAGYSIYYNSVSMNTNQNDPGYPAAINVISTVTAVGAINLRDNIFSNSQTIGTERYAIYSGAASTVFSAIDNNDYYTTGPNLGYIGSNRADLAAIQAGFGGNINSISSDPLFTSPVNLLPQSSSPVIAAAVPLPGIVDFDIVGTPRSVTASTMGAYELELLLTKTLTVTVFLEGLYDGAGGMFEAQGLAGPEFPGYADQVIVELHNDVTYATIEYSSGPVNLSTSGVVTVNDIPSSLAGSYYITIKHRNSIETTSAAPVSFAASPVSYNFTTASSQAYGDNMKLMGTVYAIFGGNANQNPVGDNQLLIDSGDMNDVENASALITFGYVVTDCNGDGLVDSGDMNIVENNSAGLVGVITP
jgi:hypothetical protein